MKIDIKRPDSYLQITNLQKLLQSTQPTKEDVAIALVLILFIFYENRPGKLDNLLQNHAIWGTGCHNPTSEKTGKTIWHIWRIEISIKHSSDLTLTVKHELMQSGYLKAVLKKGSIEQIITTDILRDRDTTTNAVNASITGSEPAYFMKDLYELLKEPLEKLSEITKSSLIST